jgi:hypothetical protein
VQGRHSSDYYLRLALQSEAAKLPRQACFELHTLKFIAEGSNALIIGKTGTGKSQVSIAPRS